MNFNSKDEIRASYLNQGDISQFALSCRYIVKVQNPKGASMFQVVVQSAMRQLKSKLKLPAPPSNSTGEKKPEEKSKDKTGLILSLALGGGILLMAMFSNLSTN
jgi:hypothetical protein